VIDVRHVSKRYGDRTAVSDLSFQVARGEVVGFLGPNGAGKSTTLRMLTGFLEASEGEIRIAGLDAQTQAVEVRKRVGYMPEAVPLYLEMRVGEYLRYRAELKGVARRAVEKSVDRALELASVADVKTRIIGQLSKGYRQRVGLADALVADPPLLILDEPTAGLDPNQIRQVRDLIRQLSKEKTVLLSTHILPEVEAICGRVIILDRGRLVSTGRPDELRSMGEGMRSLSLEARADELTLRQALSTVQGIQGAPTFTPIGTSGEVLRVRLDAEVNLVDEVAERVFRAMAQANVALRELKREDASLEEVFARLTTQEVLSEAKEDSPEVAA
jgi:ABC-2 type transport system ATP-binding protein